jgi:hypothetical protein
MRERPRHGKPINQLAATIQRDVMWWRGVPSSQSCLGTKCQIQSSSQPETNADPLWPVLHAATWLLNLLCIATLCYVMMVEFTVEISNGARAPFNPFLKEFENHTYKV